MEFMGTEGKTARKFVAESTTEEVTETTVASPEETADIPDTEEMSSAADIPVEAEAATDREPVQEEPVQEYGTGSQGVPAFLLLKDVNGEEFAGQWLPSMPKVNYIGKTSMLLTYLREQEQYHHLTMPIRACGIDPILFDNVENAMPDAPTSIFAIQPEGDSAEPALYELVEVDGERYLSCITACVDREYLNSIIADATAAVRETGKYVFQMIGYRKLALEDGHTTARLINTLRLNTYEMSALVSYMGMFENMQVSYEIINDHQCICFRV